MMNRSCRLCKKSFLIEERDLKFYERISPSFGGLKCPIPPPSSCPQCRLRKRLSFRNQIYVYSRESSLSGKPIFSMFPDEAPFPVYSRDEWWGDSWDAMSYGRDFDFSQEFFRQFRRLQLEVPQFAISSLNPENSDYCSNVTGVKDCYLVFNSAHSEDCMYGENVFKSRDCIDCTHTPYSELCYDCVECSNCYAVQSSAYCHNCRDSYYLFHCQGLKNCFGCVNLHQQEYCVFNKQCSKAEYEEFIGNIDFCSYRERAFYREKAEKFFIKHPRPHIESRMTENVSGNLLFESRNVYDSFLVHGGEDLRYVFNVVHGVKDCYDYSCFGTVAELLYECASCGSGCFNSRFCLVCWGGSS